MNDFLIKADLKKLLIDSNIDELEQYLEDIHPADILEVLRDKDLDKLKAMEKLPYG